MASGDSDAGKRWSAGIIAYALAQIPLGAPAMAEDEAMPDVELLAYLGSWLESDEEWVAIVEWDGKLDESAPTEPAPNEENDDE